MSHIVIPSAAVKAALKRASEDIHADMKRLMADPDYRKERVWSWRHFKTIERDRTDRETQEHIRRSLWVGDVYARRDALTRTTLVLAPLLEAAPMVNVSSDHFRAFSQFYKPE